MTVWSYLGRYRRLIVLGVISLLATNVVFLGIPYFMGKSVQALRDGAVEDVPMMAVWMMVCAIGTALTRIASRIYIFNAARGGEYDLRSDLFRHMLTLDAGYYRKNSTGDIMSPPHQCRADRARHVGRRRPEPRQHRVRLRHRPLHDGAHRSHAHPVGDHPLPDDLHRRPGVRPPHLQGQPGRAGRARRPLRKDPGRPRRHPAHQDLRPRGGSPPDLRRVVAAPARSQHGAHPCARASWCRCSAPSPPPAPSSSCGSAATPSSRAASNVGQLIELGGYVARLVWPTLALGWMLSLLQRGRASWGRLTALFATRPQIVDGTGPPLPVTDKPMAVSIKDLTIEIDGRTLLSGVNLELAPGTVTAVVGRTGAGKSTLVDALTRLLGRAPRHHLHRRPRLHHRPDAVLAPTDRLRPTGGRFSSPRSSPTISPWATAAVAPSPRRAPPSWRASPASRPRRTSPTTPAS